MTNRFCELVGCDLPIQQAAMTQVSTSTMVAAVSNAGGLGMIAVGRNPIEAVNAQLDEIAGLTSRPFGAGFIVKYLNHDTFDPIVEQVPIIEFFYEWPSARYVVPGKIVGWQVGSVDEAKAAVDVGCQYVVAQGVEGGGHVRGTMPLAELIPAVRAVVGEAPLIAAGGVGTAADVRQAMTLGADAVRIGTRFVASAESDVHPRYLELLIEAAADDAEFTDVFAVGWPDAPHRALASAVALARADGPDPVGYTGSYPLPRRGPSPPNKQTTGQIEAMALYAGRSVGAVTGVKPVAEIIAELLGASS